MSSNNFNPYEEHFESLNPAKPAAHTVKDHVAIRCLILRETQAAILVELAPCNSPEDEQPLKPKTEWFPLAQVSYINNIQDVMKAHDADSKRGKYTDTIHVAKWPLNKRGIQY